MKILSSAKEALLRQSVSADLAHLDASTSTKRRFTTVATAAIVSSMCAMPALAGTGGDALLKDTYDSSMGVIQGYGAKMTTGVAGAFAMIGSVFKFQPQLIASTLGVGFTGAGVDNLVDFTVTGLIM